MSRVEQIVAKQREKAEKEIRIELVKNAVDCTYYVALGEVMARDLANKYGLELADVKGLMSVQAVKLCNQIRELP